MLIFMCHTSSRVMCSESWRLAWPVHLGIGHYASGLPISVYVVNNSVRYFARYQADSVSVECPVLIHTYEYIHHINLRHVYIKKKDGWYTLDRLFTSSICSCSDGWPRDCWITSTRYLSVADAACKKVLSSTKRKQRNTCKYTYFVIYIYIYVYESKIYIPVSSSVIFSWSCSTIFMARCIESFIVIPQWAEALACWDMEREESRGGGPCSRHFKISNQNQFIQITE